MILNYIARSQAHIGSQAENGFRLSTQASNSVVRNTEEQQFEELAAS